MVKGMREGRKQNSRERDSGLGTCQGFPKMEEKKSFQDYGFQESRKGCGPWNDKERREMLEMF